MLVILRSLLCASLVLHVGMYVTVTAQTNEEIFEQFQFNFSTPGARASAMGRGFIGLADDATAAISNPAGLVILRQLQVYFEFKHNDLRVRRPALVDSLFTGQTSTFGETTDSLSFFNIAWPISQNFTVAFTRHEFLNYQERFRLAPRPIPGTKDNIELVIGGQTRAFFERSGTFDGIEAEAEFNGVSYAGTLAFNVPGTGNFSDTGLSFGFTVSVDRLEAQASTVRFVSEETVLLGPSLIPGGPPVYLKTGCTDVLGQGCTSFDVTSSAIITNQSAIDDDDIAVGFTVGGLWRQSETFAVGGVYTRSPKFNIQESFGFNPGSDPNTTPPSIPSLGITDPAVPCCFPPYIPNPFTNEPIQSFAGFPKDVPFNVPDRLGSGIVIRPIDRLQFVFDAVRIFYSDLADELAIISDFNLTSLTSDDFEINDATELHFGGEVAVLQRPLALFFRAGVFTNPEHSLKFVGEVNETGLSELQNLNRNIQLRTLFNFSGKETGPGVTVGAGINLSAIGGSDVGLQIDVAYVSIDSFNELVVSSAIRF